MTRHLRVVLICVFILTGCGKKESPSSPVSHNDAENQQAVKPPAAGVASNSSMAKEIQNDTKLRSIHDDYSSLEDFAAARRASVEAMGNAVGEKLLGMDGSEISEYGAKVQALYDDVFSRASSAADLGPVLAIKPNDFMELQAAKVAVTMFFQKYTLNSEGDWVTKIINYKPEVAQAIAEAQGVAAEINPLNNAWFVQIRKVKPRLEAYSMKYSEAQHLNKEDSLVAAAHLRAQPELYRCFYNGRWSKWVDFQALSGSGERIRGLWLTELPLFIGTNNCYQIAAEVAAGTFRKKERDAERVRVLSEKQRSRTLSDAEANELRTIEGRHSYDKMMEETTGDALRQMASVSQYFSESNRMRSLRGPQGWAAAMVINKAKELPYAEGPLVWSQAGLFRVEAAGAKQAYRWERLSQDRSGRLPCYPISTGTNETGPGEYGFVAVAPNRAEIPPEEGFPARDRQSGNNPSSSNPSQNAGNQPIAAVDSISKAEKAQDSRVTASEEPGPTKNAKAAGNRLAELSNQAQLRPGEANAEIKRRNDIVLAYSEQGFAGNILLREDMVRYATFSNVTESSIAWVAYGYARNHREAQPPMRSEDVIRFVQDALTVAQTQERPSGVQSRNTGNGTEVNVDLTKVIGNAFKGKSPAQKIRDSYKKVGKGDLDELDVAAGLLKTGSSQASQYNESVQPNGQRFDNGQRRAGSFR